MEQLSHTNSVLSRVVTFPSIEQLWKFDEDPIGMGTADRRIEPPITVTAIKITKTLNFKTKL
jgi:hypothetical protein